MPLALRKLTVVGQSDLFILTVAFSPVISMASAYGAVLTASFAVSGQNHLKRFTIFLKVRADHRAKATV